MSIASRLAELIKYSVCTFVLLAVYLTIYAACKCLNMSKGLK